MLWSSWWLGHGQKLLKWQEKPSGIYKMQENAMATGAPHRTPLGSLQRSPDPVPDGEGLAAPSQE